MDDSEKVANDYLVNLALGPIVYEPDGNVPPDFLINGTIAVEVRRLNQNEITDSWYRGLEETRIPLGDRMRSLLSSLGPAQSGASWFLRYNLERPLPEWKKLRSALCGYLLEFRDKPSPDKRVSATICEGFQIELRRAGDSYPQFFVLGGYTDEDSGGWVLQETRKNLSICIEEKTRKTAPFRHKYPEWWLILVDRIGYGVDACDEQLFREHLRFEHTWNKIVLLNPLNSRSAFELPSTLARTC